MTKHTFRMCVKRGLLVELQAELSSRFIVHAFIFLTACSLTCPFLLLWIFSSDPNSNNVLDYQDRPIFPGNIRAPIFGNNNAKSIRRTTTTTNSGIQIRPKTMNVAAKFGSNVTHIGVGFGTAGLGPNDATIRPVLAALEAGFRKFDTAEADWWYDQRSVGKAFESYFLELERGDPERRCASDDDDTCVVVGANCAKHGLRASTKIPPWELTSRMNVRQRARRSREELLSFCDDVAFEHYLDPFGAAAATTTGAEEDSEKGMLLYPMDVYYIHAPKCWEGWHNRCDGVRFEDTMDLRDSWMAMEAVVGIDHTAARIGLSNIHPDELLDIIKFVKERQKRLQNDDDDDNSHHRDPPPRMPDVIQIYADPLEPAVELRKICRQYGIEFVSYSTLGTQHRRRKNGNPVLDNDKVKALAETHGRSTAEVVLSWAMQKGMSVIPRSSQTHHIRQLANLIRGGSFLNEDDLMTIDLIARK